ncbi:MAG: hypothetical protein ACRD36_00195, partial [Candidatus Acidiferrum sp.]
KLDKPKAHSPYANYEDKMTNGGQHFLPDDPFLSVPGASALYQAEFGAPIAVGTLNKLRSIGGGPVFSRNGRRIVYRRSAILDWGNARVSHVMRSTSELA